MIKFVTDTRRGETPFPVEVFSANLLITDLEGVGMFSISAPDDGWTHAKLEALAIELDNDDRLGMMRNIGFDAYLGNQWVGSTEV